MDKNIKTALIIGGIVVAIFVILPLIVGLASGREACVYGMMGHWMMGGFGIGWLMPIFWIFILGLIIWAVVSLVRGVGSSRSQDSAKEIPAIEVLKDRYARGEISKEEFEEKRKDLM